VDFKNDKLATRVYVMRRSLAGCPITTDSFRVMYMPISIRPLKPV